MFVGGYPFLAWALRAFENMLAPKACPELKAPAVVGIWFPQLPHLCEYFASLKLEALCRVAIVLAVLRGLVTALAPENHSVDIQACTAFNRNHFSRYSLVC